MRETDVTNKQETLLQVLQRERKAGVKGGIYHKLQIEMTYNSNHIEGSSLTEDQTRYIYETNTIVSDSKGLNVDDILETANHFRCIDRIIDDAYLQITEESIKELHGILKTGTKDSRKDWFNVGAYKKLPNEVGGKETVAPEDVHAKMIDLLAGYNKKDSKSLNDILDFHYEFESIHPFQDGNGRIGRLIMLKECLKYDIVPFVIEDDLKMFYYRGLANWKMEPGYLTGTCLTAQDRFKAYLDYFKISYR